MSKKIVAKFDNIIVKVKELEETRYGNIIVPDMGKEKSIIGEVISVGPGRYSLISGVLIPTSIKVGDIVVLPQMGPTRIEIDNEEYLICSETTVASIIVEE